MTSAGEAPTAAPTEPVPAASASKTRGQLSRIQWLKHTFSVVIAGLGMRQAVSALSRLLDHHVLRWDQTDAILNGLRKVHWLHYVCLAYVLVNLLRYLLSSYATDLLASADEDPGEPQPAAARDLAGSLLDTFFSVLLVAAVGVAADSIDNLAKFALVCVVLATLDALFTTLELSLPALYLWASPLATPSAIKNYHRWTRRWIAIDLLEIAVWWFMFVELTTMNRNGYVVAYVLFAFAVLILLEVVGNFDFWITLANHTGTET